MGKPPVLQNRFSMSMSSSSDRFNATIIEERRLATKEFLNFALQPLYLRTHDAFKNFLQVNSSP